MFEKDTDSRMIAYALKSAAVMEASALFIAAVFIYAVLSGSSRQAVIEALSAAIPAAGALVTAFFAGLSAKSADETRVRRTKGVLLAAGICLFVSCGIMLVWLAMHLLAH